MKSKIVNYAWILDIGIKARKVGASVKAKDIDYFWGLKPGVGHELFSEIEILKFSGCS